MGMNTTPQLWNTSTGKYDQRLAGIDNAARVIAEGVPGVARNRFISVTTTTLPTAAGSGCAIWTSPGVRGVVIQSVRVVSATTMPAAEKADLTIRYAIDAASDAAAAILVPTAAPTSSATADVGQVGSFCVTPVLLTGVEIILPNPIYIDVSSPITRFDMVHNIGTAVVLQFGISAVEVV